MVATRPDFFNIDFGVLISCVPQREGDGKRERERERGGMWEKEREMAEIKTLGGGLDKG